MALTQGAQAGAPALVFATLQNLIVKIGEGDGGDEGDGGGRGDGSDRGDGGNKEKISWSQQHGEPSTPLAARRSKKAREGFGSEPSSSGKKRIRHLRNP